MHPACHDSSSFEPRWEGERINRRPPAEMPAARPRRPLTAVGLATTPQRRRSRTPGSDHRAYRLTRSSAHTPRVVERRTHNAEREPVSRPSILQNTGARPLTDSAVWCARTTSIDSMMHLAEGTVSPMKPGGRGVASQPSFGPRAHIIPFIRSQTRSVPGAGLRLSFRGSRGVSGFHATRQPIAHHVFVMVTVAAIRNPASVKLAEPTPQQIQHSTIRQIGLRTRDAQACRSPRTRPLVLVGLRGPAPRGQDRANQPHRRAGWVAPMRNWQCRAVPSTSSSSPISCSSTPPATAQRLDPNACRMPDLPAATPSPFMALSTVASWLLTAGVASDVKPVRGCQFPLGRRDRLRPVPMRRLNVVGRYGPAHDEDGNDHPYDQRSND